LFLAKECEYYVLQGLVNDSALRQLYLRGFLQNHGVDEATSGLLKASHGGYAFFVSARLGRKVLNSFVAQDKRCAIQELTVEATKSSIALPMGIASPYRRLINLRYFVVTKCVIIIYKDYFLLS
jgi:hypothetical protein